MHIGRMASAIAGLALPLALHRVIGPGRVLLGGVLAAVILGGLLLSRLHGRVEGWKLAIAALTGFVLYTSLR
jgi:hypothetical protein